MLSRAKTVASRSPAWTNRAAVAMPNNASRAVAVRPRPNGSPGPKSIRCRRSTSSLLQNRTISRHKDQVRAVPSSQLQAVVKPSHKAQAVALKKRWPRAVMHAVRRCQLLRSSPAPRICLFGNLLLVSRFSRP